MRRALGACLIITALLAGCGSSSAQAHHERDVPLGVLGFWTRARLLAARPFVSLRPVAKSLHGTSVGQRSVRAARVGALFDSGPTGPHFCTASVVASPGKDLLITAAHCINSGKGKGTYTKDLVFIPGYRDGNAPYGVWTPARMLVAQGWISDSDPDLDVGFVVLKPLDGKNIEDVLGANQLVTDSRYVYSVRVTGYPSSADAPVTCRNLTKKKSATQLQFECEGFTGGTSGSPWVTRFDPFTRVGTIVGVIGGYQQGGDTSAISYSSYFGPAVHQLYEEAIAASRTGA
jgi:V8-like Glu-specific endopeptidase